MSEALELLRSAQVNFDNFIAVFPVVKDHPYYKIARMQLDEGVKELES